MQRHEDILSPEKARAFNPFLCAITDKLKALIVEVQKQVSGYEVSVLIKRFLAPTSDQL